MQITIQINGQAVSVEVSVEVYTYLDQADHRDENLAHEQRRHWDMRELDEYIIVVVKQNGNISLGNLYQAANLFSIGDNPLL